MKNEECRSALGHKSNVRRLINGAKPQKGPQQFSFLTWPRRLDPNRRCEERSDAAIPLREPPGDRLVLLPRRFAPRNDTRGGGHPRGRFRAGKRRTAERTLTSSTDAGSLVVRSQGPRITGVAHFKRAGRMSGAEPPAQANTGRNASCRRREHVLRRHRASGGDRHHPGVRRGTEHSAAPDTRAIPERRSGHLRMAGGWRRARRSAPMAVQFGSAGGCGNGLASC